MNLLSKPMTSIEYLKCVKKNFMLIPLMSTYLFDLLLNKFLNLLNFKELNIY